MGKLKKIGKGIAIAVGAFFALIVIVGVTANLTNTHSSNQNNSANVVDQSKIDNANKIIGISEFYVAQVGSVYQAHFSLTGEHAEQLSSDAKVVFVVKRDDGSIVYSQNFDASQDDFKTYQRVITGAEFNAYLWQFDAQKIPHGQYELLKAYLTVTLPNGKTYNADTSVI